MLRLSRGLSRGASASRCRAVERLWNFMDPTHSEQTSFLAKNSQANVGFQFLKMAPFNRLRNPAILLYRTSTG
jgi:hypothetical protein